MYTLLLNKYNNLLQPKYRLQKLKIRSSSEIEITTLSAPKPYTRPLLFRFASIQHPFLKVDDPVYFQLQFVESFYTLPISLDTSPTRYKSLTIHIQLLTGVPYIYIYTMRVKTLKKRNNMIYQLFFRSLANPTPFFLLTFVLVCTLVKFIHSWLSIKGNRLLEMEKSQSYHVNITFVTIYA